jgi:hypothetical protein
VTASATGARTAAYDFELDAWTELPSIEAATVLSLHSTGPDVLALARVGDGETAFVPLDLDDRAWRDPVVGPLPPDAAAPLWIGDRFVSLTPTDVVPVNGTAVGDGPLAEVSVAPDEGIEAPPAVQVAPVEQAGTGFAFEPSSREWVAVDNRCAIDSGAAVWAEPFILDIDRGVGFDPRSGTCQPLPASPWAERSGALRVWTGNEVLDVSGDTGAKRPRRDGVAYDPYPGDDPLGVVLDKPSRPVRVQVPSLRIDLPVIADSRKVPGSSPGYPACDVALSWSAFDRPGKPGTAWVLAHAQEGMFLPLLETLRAKGKEALLGREVQLQLRDGRVLTYRTYRANARATNTNIGFKGRKDDEHRLVLQTSTGFGSDPKLLVAARLVDVSTTNEPRPKPKPRACG